MLADHPDVHTRVIVLGLVITAGALVFAARLFQLQVLEGGRYAQTADQSRVVSEVIAPRRGRILDRTGTPIVDNRQVYEAAVVFTDLEVPTRLRRSYSILRLDERRLGELLADLTGRVRVPAGGSLRDLVVGEFTSHPSVAVVSGPRRGDDRLALLVLPKEALDPYHAPVDEGDVAGDTAQLAESDVFGEDPVAALEREVRKRWELSATVMTDVMYQAATATLDRDFHLPAGERAADLLDPFVPAFTVALPTTALAKDAGTANPPKTTAVRLRLVIGDQLTQGSGALARVADLPPAQVHESLARAIAEARAAHPAPPSPVFFAAASDAETIAPRLPRGTVMQEISITGVPGARERILLIQGDPPDGEGLYTQLTRHVGANLGLDAVTLQSLIEAHAQVISPRQAEQDHHLKLLVLDHERLDRLADGLASELTRYGKPTTRGEVDQLLAKARRTADRAWSGQTQRDPIRLFGDLPQPFAVRFAGRDGEPPKDLLKRYEDAAAELPGLTVTLGSGRSYPFGSSLCHTLGTVGTNAADPEGPLAGRWGLEARYDQVLHGVAGSRVRIRTPNGVQIAAQDPALDGQDVTTEIDMEVQTIAEDSLEHYRELATALGTFTARMESAQAVGRSRAGFVLLDCQTGGILALASNPRFTYDQLRTDYDELVKNPAEPLFDHSAVPAQPPGSSFKILTALACLEYGVIDPGHEIYCQGFMKMENGKMLLRDHAPAGSYNLSEAIQVSSNVYFATIGSMLKAERLDLIAERIGLGRNNAIDVTQQRPGMVFNPKEIARQRPGDPRWTASDTWRLAIGQNALASPLQCACIAAAVANGGHIVRPYLVRPVDQPEVVDLHIRKEWLADVRHGMEMVTSNLDHSTARLLVLQGSATGIKVAAKTGTAEWGSSASRERGLTPDHAWMIGYAPADNPTVAFACFINSGTFGGQACTPVVKRIQEAYFAKYGRDGHAP